MAIVKCNELLIFCHSCEFIVLFFLTLVIVVFLFHQVEESQKNKREQHLTRFLFNKHTGEGGGRNKKKQH